VALRLPRRNDSARARPVVSAWWGPPVSGRCSRLQLMHAAREIRGVRLPRVYKSQEREGEVPYLVT
jgi:hypothetical protein